ncbi:MAG: xylulokinase [Actinomycetota bacterium]
MHLLTIDLGSAVTKAALWSTDGLLGVGRAPVRTLHRRPEWAEQDPETWWTSTVEACGQLPAEERRHVGAIGFSTQRETFVPVNAVGEPVGPAIMSSDRRAAAEAAELGEDFQVLTGIVPDAGAVAAKLAWIRRHEPDRLDGQRWILGPRDLLALRLTGRAVTDASVASRTGLLAFDGARLEGAQLLPEIVSSSTVVGEALPDPAEALGVMSGTRIVAGAADRACEVLGVAATTSRPMVTWGMTAAVSVPVGHVPPPHPGIVVSRGAIGGYLMEAELSAAGWALKWLEDITGRPAEQLAREADDVDAGAGGLLALAWLGGARAPWWQPRAGLTFTGLSPAHTPAHLARALVEGVAFDAARCLERTAPDAVELALAGAGVSIPLWRHVLAGVSSRPVVTRRHGEAASAGAAIVTGRALGMELDPDVLDPVGQREHPFDSDVVAYADLRMRHEMFARATIELVAGV